MAFVLNPTRKLTVKYIDPENDDSFEADFEFPLTEDCFTDEMREKIKNYEKVLKDDSDEEKERKLFKNQSVMWCKIRCGLKSVRGINDTEGNPIIVTSENQGAVFEFITNFGDVGSQALIGFLGLNSKN